jgi:hypothetical protein
LLTKSIISTHIVDNHIIDLTYFIGVFLAIMNGKLKMQAFHFITFLLKLQIIGS